MSSDEGVEFPEKPAEPMDSDCCGTGCTPCVFDLYEQDLKRWRMECDRIRNGISVSTDSQQHCINRDQYQKFTLEDIEKITDDTFLYRFQIPSGGSLGLTVGQHIVLCGNIHDRYLTRQYTPVSELNAQGYFLILIKLYAEGKMSEYVRQWKVGDEIQWRGPYGSLTYKANSYRHVAMLCAGTGIAPILQVIRHIVENEDDETFVHLFYSCKTYKDILCKSYLDAWSDFWNFNTQYFITQEIPQNCVVKYGDMVNFGRLDYDAVKMSLDSFDADKTLVLICGTTSFDKDMINHVRKCGIQNYFKF